MPLDVMFTLFFLVTSNTCLCSCDSYQKVFLLYKWEWKKFSWGPNSYKMVFGVCLRLTWHRAPTGSYSSSDTKVVLHCETNPPHPQFISAGFIIFFGVCRRGSGARALLRALCLQYKYVFINFCLQSFHFHVILLFVYRQHFGKWLKKKLKKIKKALEERRPLPLQLISSLHNIVGWVLKSHWLWTPPTYVWLLLQDKHPYTNNQKPSSTLCCCPWVTIHYYTYIII